MNQLQQTPLWEQQRIGKITASRVGAILGLSEFADRDSVMRDMVRQYHGAEKEFFGNPATEWGNKYECDALAAAEQRYGTLIESQGFITQGIYGCSPDGFYGTKNGHLLPSGIEIKVPYRKAVEEVVEDPSYHAQCLFSLIVCDDRIRWDLFSWDARTGACACRAFFKSEAEDWFDLVEPELQLFHAQYCHIVADEELSAPYLQPLELDKNDDPEWMAAVIRLTSARRSKESADAAEAEAKQRLIELADGRKSRGCGVLLYPNKGRTFTDYKKACEDYGIDLDEYRKTKDELTWSVKLL